MLKKKFLFKLDTNKLKFKKKNKIENQNKSKKKSLCLRIRRISLLSFALPKFEPHNALSRVVE